MARDTAPDDGVYVINGVRYRARKGQRMPANADFISNADQENEAKKAANGNGDKVPKWYQERAAKAEENGETIPPLEPGETQRAYEERIALIGPDENTGGSGPSETT